MPFLFLSPSTQEFNPYITTGNEEYWMNLLADAMEPYLRAAAVNFSRNDPTGSAAASIRQSNAGAYDFHLALHSNATGQEGAGGVRGIDVYYYPTSNDGLAMATLIAGRLRTVYPLPDRVRAVPTTNLGEIRRTRAPAVLAELGYHDNPEDAAWIENNLDPIAGALVQAVTEYFGLPFLQPEPVRTGTVRVNSGGVNLRTHPDLNSGVYLTIPNGGEVRIYAAYEDWYAVGYGTTLGYVKADYVAVN